MNLDNCVVNFILKVALTPIGFVLDRFLPDFGNAALAFEREARAMDKGPHWKPYNKQEK